MEAPRGQDVCRLCGLSSTKNVNMFLNPDFVNKVLLVYPIMICRDDPLPKQVCQKCVNVVNKIYHCLTGVVRVQNRFIAEKRRQQPDHQYVQLLDTIESVKEAAVKSIDGEARKSAMRCFERVIMLQNPTKDTIVSRQLPQLNERPALPRNFDIEDPPLLGFEPTKMEPVIPEPPVPTFQCDVCREAFSTENACLMHKSAAHLKVRVPKIFPKRLITRSAMQGRKINSAGAADSVRCVHCLRVYENNKSILDHWKNGLCEFYCVICGKEFPKAARALREHEHQVHGLSHKACKAAAKDYERWIHPELIEITDDDDNDDASASARPPPAKKPSMPTLGTNKSSNLVCKHCNRSFQTKHARNSHMRMHRPSHVFGDKTSLDYNDEYYASRDVSPKQTDRYYHNDRRSDSPPKLTTAQSVKSPQHRLMPTTDRQESGASGSAQIRGIRTKFVSRRNENKPNLAQQAPAATQASKLETLLTLGKQQAHRRPIANLSQSSTTITLPLPAEPRLRIVTSSHTVAQRPTIIVPNAMPRPMIYPGANATIRASTGIRVRSVNELQDHRIQARQRVLHTPSANPAQLGTKQHHRMQANQP